jgi:hypothetical protein
MFLFLFSQEIISQSKQEIIASGKYYYGEATGEQEREARDHALKAISEQIAVKVSSFSERDIVEKNGDLKDAFRNIIHTYAQATLSNVQTFNTKNDDGINVFCYIAKTEVGKIFDDRKQLVKNIYQKGMQFETEGNITDALKYYYFAIILMNSVPEKTITFNDQNLVIEIPTRINAVISNSKFTVVADRRINDKEREIEMSIDAMGKTTRQVDFSFWDGNSQVNVRAADGIGLFRLYGASASFDQLNIELKYKFYESREEIAEVSELWDLVVKPSFKNSRSIPLRVGAVTKSSTPITKSDPLLPTLTLVNNENSPVASRIETETKKLLALLGENNIAGIKTAYASDKFLVEKIQGLLKYNKVLTTSGLTNAEIHRTATGWEVRQIPIICSYPSLQRQSTEYLIVDFTKSGVLDDANFGTLKSIYSQFVTQGLMGDDWGNRQVIIKFMERYRTAYMTRNMEMLDSLFADEAVIIVGRELKKGKKRDDIQYSKLNEAQPDFSYTQYTKAEYLKNQRKVFQSQKDLMLGFSTFKILRKNDSSGTYGISMKQNYTSTTYADEGHLFLLVDFQQEQPQIYVRSWQPREWNDDAIIKLSNFRVNK